MDRKIIDILRELPDEDKNRISLELARRDIDLEEDLLPTLEKLGYVVKEVLSLAMKNRNFLDKGGR